MPSFAQTIVAHPDSLAVEAELVNNRKTRLLPVPLVQYSPETSLLLGISTLYTFYADKKDLSTRPSFIFATGLYTLKEQAVLDGYINGWTKQNKLHYQFEASYYVSNYYYYGIGSSTRLDNEEYILYKKKQVYLIGERKITSKMYLGGELDYKVESHRNKDKSALPEETHPGAPGDELTRVGMSVVYDSRDIYTSATTGAFYKLIYSKLLHILGSLANFDQIKFESRNFFTLRPKHILGFNSNYESLQGDNRPFYLLPQMGSSFIQRGYYQGRYREQNYAAVQAEYRWNFFRKFGMAAFIGAGEVFKNKEFNFPDVKPNWGIGLRYLYDEVSRINFRVDYGWGTKAAGENRVEGVYFSIGEAF